MEAKRAEGPTMPQQEEARPAVQTATEFGTVAASRLREYGAARKPVSAPLLSARRIAATGSVTLLAMWHFGTRLWPPLRDHAPPPRHSSHCGRLASDGTTA